MRIDEYLDRVCQEIKWKAARKPVRREIQTHIDQRTDEYMANGDTKDLAEEKAVANMGDAGQTGRELNRLHKPRYDLVLIGSLMGLLVLGFLYSLTMCLNSNIANWIVATLSGLAGCCLFTFIDIRKIFSKKPVYLSLFFGINLLFIVQILLNRYPTSILTILTSFSPVIMLLSISVWISNIKSNKGLFWFFISMIPVSVLCFSSTLLAYVWVMLWTVKVKKRNLILVAIPSIMILSFIVLSFLNDSYWLHMLIRSFSDPSMVNPMQLQVQHMVANLNWFGAGHFSQDIIVNYTLDNEYALINFTWQYGLAAGLATVSLCGVMLWRTYKMILGIKDTIGRTTAIGLCTFIALLILSNVLLNIGVGPIYNMPVTFGYIPMFSQIWQQTFIFGSMIGILIGLYRKKDIYNAKVIYEGSPHAAA